MFQNGRKILTFGCPSNDLAHYQGCQMKI